MAGEGMPERAANMRGQFPSLSTAISGVSARPAVPNLSVGMIA
jgi:hypothetical protein